MQTGLKYKQETCMLQSKAKGLKVRANINIVINTTQAFSCF